MNRIRMSALLAMAFGLCLSTSAAAQTTVGVRAGASIDPDQFYFGGHVETPPIADRVRFRPNVEVGLGNDLTLIAFNVELAYHFPPRRDWHFYAGGGPALNVIDTSSETDAAGGVNAMIGVAHERGLFFELKLGFIDSPDVKIGVGYTFGR
jgi:hypothetical protein